MKIAGPCRYCVNSVSQNLIQALHFMTTVVALRRVKTMQNVIEIHGSSHPFKVYDRLSRLSLAKMFHFHNLKHFILLLISSFPLYTKSSGNYSDFFPGVINTWAGNHEVATDKGDEATAVYSTRLGAKLFMKLVMLENYYACFKLSTFKSVKEVVCKLK